MIWDGEKEKHTVQNFWKVIWKKETETDKKELTHYKFNNYRKKLSIMYRDSLLKNISKIGGKKSQIWG